MECGKEGGLFGDRIVKWILVDYWARGHLSHTVSSSSCQGSGQTGDTGLTLAAPSGPASQSMRPCLSLFSTKSGLLAWKHLYQQFLIGAGLWSREQDGSFLSTWLLGKEGVLCQGQCARAEDSAFLLEPGLPSEAVSAAPGVLGVLVCIAHEWYTWSRHYSFLAIGTGIFPVMPGFCLALQIYSISSFTFSKIPL